MLQEIITPRRPRIWTPPEKRIIRTTPPGAGYSLGVGGRAGKKFASGGADAFDPATLALTGWWRASYAASPWVGTASAGGSGSRDLTEATNTPDAGTAVNGFAPASFVAANSDVLSGAAISNFVSASAYLYWFLFKSSVTGGSAGFDSNPGLWMDHGNGFMGATFRNAAGVEKIEVGHFSGGYTTNQHTIALDAWQLLCVRYDGSNIKSSVNGGAVTTSGAVGNVGGLTGALTVGRQYSSVFGTFHLLDAGFMASAESDARFDDILDYVRGRYPATGI